MLRAEHFLLSEERDYRSRVESHPALFLLKARLPEYWRRDCGGPAAVLQQDAEPLTEAAQPELWQAVRRALRLVDSELDFEIYAVGAIGDPLAGASVAAHGRSLSVFVPRALLAGIHGAELFSVIGHAFGHYLLGHDRSPDVRALLAVLNDDLAVVRDERIEALWYEDDMVELFRLGMVLSQLQELGADRFGLLVCGDFEAAAAAAIKLTYGYAGGRCSVDDGVLDIQPVSDEPDWVIRLQPSAPHRCLALRLFYESDLYRREAGLGGGVPITAFQEALPRLVPLFATVAYPSASAGRPERDQVDDDLLELFLMDTVAVADAGRDQATERMIARYLSPQTCDRALDRYDEITASLDDDDMEQLCIWLAKAARKDSSWKLKMIERFLGIVRGGSRIRDEQLAEVAGLASAIGAQRECRQLYRFAFGYDPYEWLGEVTTPDVRRTSWALKWPSQLSYS